MSRSSFAFSACSCDRVCGGNPRPMERAWRMAISALYADAKKDVNVGWKASWVPAGGQMLV